MWLGCPNSEVPKIEYGVAVCSIVTATGFDAHIKFFFDVDSFMFRPEVEEFEVSSFFKAGPYRYLQLLRAAFGDHERKIFELLESMEFGTPPYSFFPLPSLCLPFLFFP
jgi:hypothetical protein